MIYVDGCFVTNFRYSSDADAIVFHIRDLNTSDLPLRRSPKQFYVFLLLESPHYTGKSLWEKINGTTKYKIPDDYFNLTVTYRSVNCFVSNGFTDVLLYFEKGFFCQVKPHFMVVTFSF